MVNVWCCSWETWLELHLNPCNCSQAGRDFKGSFLLLQKLPSLWQTEARWVTRKVTPSHSQTATNTGASCKPRPCWRQQTLKPRTPRRGTALTQVNDGSYQPAQPAWRQSQMEAVAADACISQLGPCFTPKGNARALAFLMLNPTGLILSHSANTDAYFPLH